MLFCRDGKFTVQTAILFILSLLQGLLWAPATSQNPNFPLLTCAEAKKKRTRALLYGIGSLFSLPLHCVLTGSQPPPCKTSCSLRHQVF